jgi:hypothetical protein
MSQTEIIFSAQKSPQGGYAHALEYPIFTQAESIDELKTMLPESVACHFGESSNPRVISLHTVSD